LYCHNETGNVWTHLVGLIIFTILLAQELLRSDKPTHHIIVSSGYLLATNFCMASSAFFHLASPHSMLSYERALRIDMTGIALVIIASFL
jgi:adiponectin receptor